MTKTNRETSVLHFIFENKFTKNESAIRWHRGTGFFFSLYISPNNRKNKKKRQTDQILFLTLRKNKKKKRREKRKMSFGFKQNMEWFDSLEQPKLQPPKYMFTVVWIVLYALLITIFVYLYFIGNNTIGVNPSIIVAAQVLFAFQLFFNLIWFPIFFNKRNISLAFVCLTLILVLSVPLIALFFEFDSSLGWMYFPYLLWIAFAFVLNLLFMILNPSELKRKIQPATTTTTAPVIL